ncbi:DEGP9, partial [Symbiodinium sp. CCMP2456]
PEPQPSRAVAGEQQSGEVPQVRIPKQGGCGLRPKSGDEGSAWHPLPEHDPSRAVTASV